MNTTVKENQNETTLLEGYVTAKEETIACKTEKVNLPFEVKEGEEYFIEEIGALKRKPVYSLLKRLFDILISLVSLVVLSPLFLIISVIIKCSSKGPIFYCQERLGLNGRKFKVIKFRTMVVDAEKDGARWSDGDNDDRIYKFGKILRKSRLDELPQLICCFIGTMTFVGPRPERECFYVEFEKYIHGFSQRLKVKPGITGLAQVNGGYDLKPQEKILLDIEYMKKRSLWQDMKIMFKTIAVVFNHKGAK